MMKDQIVAAFQEFIGGTRSPLDYIEWWKTHESAVKDVVSPGAFNRLKPRGHSEDAMTAVWRCFNEMKAVLERHGVATPLNTSTERVFAAHLAERERRIDFGAEVLRVCMARYHAAPNDQAWLDGLRRELDAQCPTDRAAWLVERLRDEFRFVHTPPRWIKEPEWPFRDGKPLVFVTQYTIPENATTRGHLTWDETLYVFGRRVKRGDGVDTEYVIVGQLAEIGE